MKKTIIAVTFVAMFLAILVIAMKRAHKEHNGKAMTQLSFSVAVHGGRSTSVVSCFLMRTTIPFDLNHAPRLSVSDWGGG